MNIPAGNAHLPADRLSVESTDPASKSTELAFLEEVRLWEAPTETERSVYEPSRPLASDGVSSRGNDAALPLVLLVDDNADMRDYIERLLAPQFRVVKAVDGEQALALLERDRPDLVLSDVMMPNLDGFGLVRRIRAEARWRELPVILLSARAGEEARTEGRDAVVDDYVVKPFAARELLARISNRTRDEPADHAAREAVGRANNDFRRRCPPPRSGLRFFRRFATPPARSPSSSGNI